MSLPLGQKKKRKKRKSRWQTLALDAALTLFLISFPFHLWFFFSLVAGVFLDVLVVHPGLPIAKWQRSSWRKSVHSDLPEETAQELKEITRKSCLRLSRIWKVWRHRHELKRQLDGIRTEEEDNSPAVFGLFVVQSKDKCREELKQLSGDKKKHLTVSDGKVCCGLPVGLCSRWSHVGSSLYATLNMNILVDAPFCLATFASNPRKSPNINIE